MAEYRPLESGLVLKAHEKNSSYIINPFGLKSHSGVTLLLLEDNSRSSEYLTRTDWRSADRMARNKLMKDDYIYDPLNRHAEHKAHQEKLLSGECDEENKSLKGSFLDIGLPRIPRGNPGQLIAREVAEAIETYKQELREKIIGKTAFFLQTACQEGDVNKLIDDVLSLLDL